MRATKVLGYYTEQGPYRAAVSMMAKGSIVTVSVSEVFFIFTTQLYPCFDHYNATVFIS